MKFKKVLSLVLVSALAGSLVGCSGSTTSSTTTGTDTTADNSKTESAATETAATTEADTDTAEVDLSDIIPDETVTLNVYSQLANYEGEQIGWFAQIMKDKFNVKLNIISNGDGVFDTRMESGDLGDIVAFAIFSTDGFVSSLLVNNGILDSGVNFLMDNSHMWLKMLAWGMWKGLGWSAIIYIAAISGIDQQLYEAAEIDGAGRFQKMWNITVPSLMPTFMVLLLMAIAGILNNGMDQYLVFENAYNTDTITVLDLYVYKLGINSGRVPLATVVGMFKSVISVVLLFGANKISKLVRGESII